MKISELIEELEKVLKEKGDGKIAVPSGDYDYEYVKATYCYFTDKEILLSEGEPVLCKNVFIIQ